MRQLHRSFTLVEILVVVAIISLLAAIVYPALQRARNAAASVQCKANLHAVGVAFRMYLNESSDIMPVASQMPSLGLDDDPRIADVLGPYLSSPNSLKCPRDTVKDYFASEGSSYEYRSMLGGRKVTDSFLTRRLGQDRTPVLHDYETFHGEPGKPGAMNYLFADGHVGDLK